MHVDNIENLSFIVFFRILQSHLYKTIIEPYQWPIVYSDAYNITFYGLQKLHIFDSEKWGRIFEFLKGNLSHEVG